MAKRPTPIERAIAGESADRQARYRKRLNERGLHRTTVTVPLGRLQELRAICARWVAEFEGQRDD